MSTKRYGVTVNPEVWQTWRMLSLKAGMTVGEWLTEQVNFPAKPGSEQVAMPGGWAGIHPDLKHMDETRERMNKEASVQEPIKKAIEPDKTKIQNGKLTKGLGKIPGVTNDKPTDSYHSWNPAPKPGKK